MIGSATGTMTIGKRTVGMNLGPTTTGEMTTETAEIREMYEKRVIGKGTIESLGILATSVIHETHGIRETHEIRGTTATTLEITVTLVTETCHVGSHTRLPGVLTHALIRGLTAGRSERSLRRALLRPAPPKQR